MHIFELERGDQGLQSLGHGLRGVRVYDEDGAFFTHCALWVGELPSEKVNWRICLCCGCASDVITGFGLEI